MKLGTLFYTLSLALLVNASAATALASTSPVIVNSNFHTGYLPDGFDTNDSVEIVGEGLLNNSCYRAANVDVNVDHATMRIELSPKAYFYDSLCLQVLIPYHQVISLGILNAGRYTVSDTVRKLDLGEINVRLATSSSPDDFLYAPVSQAFFKYESGSAFVTISGEFTNSCMRLSQVLMSVQPKVITVQPIMEMEEGVLCADGMFPFERKVQVSGLSPKQRYLLHVRALNGKSINNLIQSE
jgi:hypothetical protein